MTERSHSLAWAFVPILVGHLCSTISAVGQQLAQTAVETPFRQWPTGALQAQAQKKYSLQSPPYRARPIPPEGPHLNPSEAESNAKTEIIAEICELRLKGHGLAALYRKYSGHRVIVSAAAATAEFRFVVDASPQHPLPFAKVVQKLKQAAAIENFAFIENKVDADLVILTLNEGIRIIERGPPVIKDGEPLPEDDVLISYIMQLKYIRPAEAEGIFKTALAPIPPPGSIAVIPGASAVLITAKTALIRKLIEFKNTIDKPSV